MNEEQLYEQIDAYLSGELQGRALDKFKADLKVDPQLQKTVDLQIEIVKALKSERETELKAYISKETSKSTFVITPRMKTVLSTAAAILLLAVVSILLLPYLKNSTDSTATENTNSIKDTSTSESFDNVTKIDTQTLAIEDSKLPETKSAEMLPEETEQEPIIEEVEDYKTDIDEELDVPEDNSETLDKSSNEVKDPVADIETDAVKKLATPSKDKEIQVKSDEILSTKSYPVYAVALDMDETVETISLESTKIRSSRADKKAEEKSDAVIESTAGKSPPIVTRQVNVEYWKSVVNYKGYQYDGSKIKLYGVAPDAAISFKELDNRLYVKMNGKNYYLERNQKYNRIVEVTNPTLLKVLND